MTILEVIKNIPEPLVNFVSALVGGAFTLMGSHYAIKRQFAEQEKVAYRNEINNQRIALKSVQTEIKQNMAFLITMIDSMKEDNITHVSFNDNNTTLHLSITRWVKHADALEKIECEETTDSVTKFYMAISTMLGQNSVTTNQSDYLLNMGKDAGKKLETEIIKLKEIESSIASK